MNDNYYCIIMAGGVGSGFWPLSKESKPKQFLDVLGTGKSLLQQAYERFAKICLPENIYIITNQKHEHLAKKQLDVDDSQILAEPFRRNTAPCIAYVNAHIAKRNPEANVVVAPSDHLILDEAEFQKIIYQGFEFTATNKALLTLGVAPNRIETGYGYIQLGEKTGFEGVRSIKTFAEKPEYEMAKTFLETGDFYWNSGIFIWSLPVIQKAFKQHLPEIFMLFNNQNIEVSNASEPEVLRDTYAQCPNVSLDYGILEKAENVYVICADFGWSDLGTWGTLYEFAEKDEKDNVIIADNTFTYDVKNCMVSVSKGKIALLQGLDGYIVVEAHNAIMVCKKDDEQQIYEFIKDVRMQKGDGYI